jgi:hypothetical protein
VPSMVTDCRGAACTVEASITVVIARKQALQSGRSSSLSLVERLEENGKNWMDVLRLLQWRVWKNGLLRLILIFYSGESGGTMLQIAESVAEKIQSGDGTAGLQSDDLVLYCRCKTKSIKLKTYDYRSEGDHFALKLHDPQP